MGEVVRIEYEVIDIPGLHWQIPYARLEDVTPTPSMPAAVLAVAVSISQLCGTILSIDAAESQAIIDFGAGPTYWHTVRNVLTYAGAVENTWGALNIGHLVYYDRSATMPAGVYLSTSPLDNTGAVNPLFGWAMCRSDADAALFPKGGAAASSTDMAVTQRGAGGG